MCCWTRESTSIRHSARPTGSAPCRATPPTSSPTCRSSGSSSFRATTRGASSSTTRLRTGHGCRTRSTPECTPLRSRCPTPSPMTTPPGRRPPDAPRCASPRISPKRTSSNPCRQGSATRTRRCGSTSGTWRTIWPASRVSTTTAGSTSASSADAGPQFLAGPYGRDRAPRTGRMNVLPVLGTRRPVP